MPKLNDMGQDPPVKLLLVGDPKSGKTGSIAALVKAGYKVMLHNYESEAHLAPLLMYLTPEEQERVVVATLRDDLRLQGSQIWPRKPPTAFLRGLNMLDKWKDGDTDYGSIYDWGPDTVYVCDNLTRMGAAAMWYTLHKNARKGKNKRKKDWGEAIEAQSQFLELLMSDSIHCNIVVIAHLKLLSPDEKDDEDEEMSTDITKPIVTPTQARTAVDYKRYPSALGQKLPENVGGYFSGIIEAKVVGTGRNTKRVLRTVPEPDVDIAVPALGLPSEIPIEDGLAKVFEAIKNPRRAA